MKRLRPDAFGTFGWIFADVFLALVVVFMATQAGTTPGSAAPTTTSTAAPTTTTTSAVPFGVDSRFVCFRLDTNPAVLTGGDTPERLVHVDQLRQQVAGRLTMPDLAGRKAGIVLTFGVASEPAAGKVLSGEVNTDVLPHVGDTFTRTDGQPVASQAYWDGSSRPGIADGSVAIHVYPITDAAHAPLPPEYEQPC